ncbi:MAG: hypothetical protein L6W00_26150 [Lentisphaeria bacterium]|nr:MAG: hypothetical protein L6W00_26150 [Lentisphaeria bacterium]
MMDRASALFKGFMPVLYDFNVEPKLLDRNGYMTGTVRDARQFDQLQQPVQRCGSVRFNTPRIALGAAILTSHKFRFLIPNVAPAPVL